jgi:hypothetical protein
MKNTLDPKERKLICYAAIAAIAAWLLVAILKLILP